MNEKELTPFEQAIIKRLDAIETTVNQIQRDVIQLTIVWTISVGFRLGFQEICDFSESF